MYYKEELHLKTKLQKKFTRKDECIWIVYPAGAGGDLLSSILNKHFSNTCTQDFGITRKGQVIISQTDGKIVNKKYNTEKALICNESLIDNINDNISRLNTDYTKIDMVLFTNHAWQDFKVEKILDYFPKSKILRLVAKSERENRLINMLRNYKHNTDFISNTLNFNFLEHDRVLNIPFSQLLDTKTFDVWYDKIIKHLNLPYKLVRFDYVNFWIEQQNNEIKKELL